MSKTLNKILTTAALAIVPATSFALPIDWHGSFGVDASIISDFNRVKNASTGAINSGSQEIPTGAGRKDSASWQSYVFKLAPTMIINDSATFKGEITSGYGFGGFSGDATATNANNTNGAPLYYHNESLGKELLIRKAYIELYSDTATYMLGRHTHQWALGAIYNDGSNTWDRHASSRDGITMKLKIGNFNVSPFWAKVNSSGLTKNTDTTEYGAALLYDNQERDIAFGINFTKKKTNGDGEFYQSTTSDPSTPATTVYLTESDLTVTDLYFKKTWGNFDLGVEVPLFSGDLGNAYGAGGKQGISAKAVIVETNYQANDSWKFSLKGGQVSGSDGNTSKFQAMNLNPNYQIANLLFRYNMMAFGAGADRNAMYDSYITNSMYLRLGANYTTEKWIFDTAIIHAKATEVAKNSSSAYNHTTNKMFTALADQDDNLGTEIDLNATYKWNKEINLGLGIGYLLTGDYFAFNNSPTPNETKNTFIVQFNTSVNF